MNNNNFKETAEKYRREMMQLYGKAPKTGAQNPPPPMEDTPRPENRPTPPPQQQPQPPQTKPTPAPFPQIPPPAPIPPRPKPPGEDIDSRFPPPVLPPFIADDRAPVDNDLNTQMNSQIIEDELPDFFVENPPFHVEQSPPPPGGNPDTAYGYLQVQVRTGDSGLPLPNAAVTISREIDGKNTIIRQTVTDINGETEVIPLPTLVTVPNPTTPAEYAQYMTYNIEAFYKDFMRGNSVNVPVFQGIKTIQTFNLIPKPYKYPLVTENQEPQI